MNKQNPIFENCPVCNSGESSPFLEHDDISLKRCNSCQVVWWECPPSRASIKQYFQDEYITNENRLTEKFIDYRAQALSLIASHVKKQVGKTDPALLDLGTASGSFLQQISELGITRVTGVEPSSYAAESVRRRLGVRVLDGFIEDQAFDNESFDIVTCLDTLCLVSEPHIDVAEIARVLKPDGHCFIELPGFHYRMIKGTGYIGRFLYPDKPGIQLGVHTLYFNKPSLKQLFKMHELEMAGAIPVGGPVYGSSVTRLIKRCGFAVLAGAYRLLGGKLEVAPKVLYEFRKAP